MFFKLIDKYTIRKAPKPLHIEGNDIFTTSEKIYNEQGFYRVVNTEYPQDEKAYRPIYVMSNNVILQEWEEMSIETEGME